MADSLAVKADLRQVQVFISSPSDVMPEREIAERVVARLDGIWKAHVRLRAERWERRHYEAVKGFQEAIGKMGAYDVVIGIIWKRIGSPLPPDLYQRTDGSQYESGTVFELETAIASSEAQGTPAVYLFRKTAPVEFAAETVEEDQRQYKTLVDWWNRTTRDADGHFRRGYQEFPTLEEFEQSLEALLENYIRQKSLIPTGPAWDVETKGSPFPGLLPYDSAYSAVFFGRALAAAGALDDIMAAAKRDTPVLFIVGPSGSGKSSLARAGLSPYFTGGQIEGVDFWRHLAVEPAQDPVLDLAQRLYGREGIPELAEGPQSTPESFAQLIRQSGDGAAQAIKWGLAQAASAVQKQVGGGRLPVGRLLLVLDQLETVLDSPHQQVIAGFARALVESETTWVIATLRSDRYPDLQLDPDFLKLRRRGALFDLPPPGPSEIADIIKGPARSAALIFEERDGVPLAKVIGAAVSGADALPLLQMTLARLFEARDGLTLTYSAYEAMGGLEGGIAAHAESVFATVSPAGQATLDALLRSLVADIGDDGRLTLRTPDRDAVASDEASRELVDKMTEARLLVSDVGVRVAHESLLRRWKRAAASPALQAEAIRLRRQIEPNFEVWHKTGLEDDLLQPGTALAAAEVVVRRHPGAFPPDIDDYVKRSADAAEARAMAEKTRALAEARRARWRAYAAMGIAIVLAAFTVLIFRLYSDANQNFILALLTKADQLLVEEKPSRALVVAGSLDESTVFGNLMETVGVLNTKTEEAVRVKTIAEITGPASSIPMRTIKSSHAATASALSADGDRFAVGYTNRKIIVGRTQGAGKESHLLGHSGRIWRITFSRDGKWLVSASSGEILLWDLERKQAKSLCDPESRITDMAIDPGGRYLAWATKDGRISVWNFQTSERISFPEHRRWALAVDFSSDGTLLASSGDDGMVVVRETKNWSVVRKIQTDRIDLVSVSFRPDGKRIATASLAGPVDVWNIDGDGSENSGLSIPVPQDKRWRVGFSPDQRWLAIASWEGTIRFWDANTFQYRGTIDGNDHRVNDISFSRDGSRLLTASESGTVRLWNLETMQPMFNDTPADGREIIIGKYSPDGSKFVAGGKDGFAKLYRVDESGRLQFACAVKHNNWVISAAFSPDSKRVVSIGIGEGQYVDDDVMKIWDADSCKPANIVVDLDRAYVHTVAFSPMGNRIAWGTRTGEVWLADLQEGFRRTRLPQVHTGAVYEIDFSPDGRFLVSGGVDARVVVWDVEAKTVYRELAGHKRGVYTVRFGGRRLIASGGADERILVWDITRPKGEELVEELAVRGGSNRLAFNRDGTILAVGSDARYVAKWSVGNWEKIFQLNALVGVRSVYGFHPTRGDLAFDGQKGLIRVLPKRQAPNAEHLNGDLRGMDVFFDQIPTNMAPDEDAEIIRSGGNVCPSK